MQIFDNRIVKKTFSCDLYQKRKKTATGRLVEFGHRCGRELVERFGPINAVIQSVIVGSLFCPPTSLTSILLFCPVLSSY